MKSTSPRNTPAENTANDTKVDGLASTVDEAERTYTFPNGTVTFNDVKRVIIRPSGTHRIATADGRLHIVAKGWLAISIIDRTGDWTF